MFNSETVTLAVGWGWNWTKMRTEMRRWFSDDGTKLLRPESGECDLDSGHGHCHIGTEEDVRAVVLNLGCISGSSEELSTVLKPSSTLRTIGLIFWVQPETQEIVFSHWGWEPLGGHSKALEDLMGSMWRG